MTYKVNPRTDKPENSVLTDGQREFLRSDESGYAKSTQSDYWNAIERRTWNAFLDFTLLLDELPADRRRQIFDVEHGMDTDRQLHDQLRATLALIYTGVNGPPKFNQILENAVGMGEHELGNSRPMGTEVDLDIRYTEPLADNMDDVVEAVQNRELGRLSRYEMESLLMALIFTDEFDGMLEELRANVENRTEGSDSVEFPPSRMDGIDPDDLHEP